MKISRTLSALAIVAILAPMPAAASDLTMFEQGRPAKKTAETLRQRMAERRAIAAERRQSQSKRLKALRTARQRKLSSTLLRHQLERRLRQMKIRIARRLR
jgi:hypothetical protein